VEEKPIFQKQELEQWDEKFAQGFSITIDIIYSINHNKLCILVVYGVSKVPLKIGSLKKDDDLPKVEFPELVIPSDLEKFYINIISEA